MRLKQYIKESVAAASGKGGYVKEMGAAETYERTFPLAEYIENLKNLYDNLSSAMTSYVSMVFEIKEALDVGGALAEIDKKIVIAEKYKVMLYKFTPENFTDNTIAMKVNTWCNIIDGYVYEMNSSIFDLIENGHWVNNQQVAFRSRYLTLVGLNADHSSLVHSFYRKCFLLNGNNSDMIPRTYSIIGKLIFNEAKFVSNKPSLPYEWIGERQFMTNMNPAELKPKVQKK